MFIDINESNMKVIFLLPIIYEPCQEKTCLFLFKTK